MMYTFYVYVETFMELQPSRNTFTLVGQDVDAKLHFRHKDTQDLEVQCICNRSEPEQAPYLLLLSVVW